MNELPSFFLWRSSPSIPKALYHFLSSVRKEGVNLGSYQAGSSALWDMVMVMKTKKKYSQELRHAQPVCKIFI